MATLTSTKNPTIIRNPNPEPRRILTLPKKTAPVITRDPNFVPGSSYVAPVNSNPNANIAPGYLSPELYNQQVNVGNMYNQDYQQAANSIIGLSDAFYQPLMADQAKFEQLNAAIGAEQTQNLMDIQRQIESQYGPDGELNRASKDFYDNYYADLAQKEGRANIANQNDALSRGLVGSVGRNINAFNSNPYRDEYNKARANQVSELEKTYQAYNNYLLQLQEKFAGTQDKYIIGVYNQALANKQAIGTQLMNQLVALRNQQSAEAISNRNTARDFSNTRLLNADEFNYQQQLANAARGGGSGGAPAVASSSTTPTTTPKATTTTTTNNQASGYNPNIIIYEGIAGPGGTVNGRPISGLRAGEKYQLTLDGRIFRKP